MLDAITAFIAVLDEATAFIAVLDAITAAIAVLDAITAAIVTLLAAIRRACPDILSSTFHSLSRPVSSSRVWSCAPVVIPASMELSIRIARIIGIVVSFRI